jgi:hypothetical protein
MEMGLLKETTAVTNEAVFAERTKMQMVCEGRAPWSHPNLVSLVFTKWTSTQQHMARLLEYGGPHPLHNKALDP